MAKNFEEIENYQLIAQEKNRKKHRLGKLPTTKAEWVYLADALLKWAYLSTSKDMKDFSVVRGLSWQKLKKWAESGENEYFAEVWHQAYAILDARRDKPLLNQSEPMLNRDYWNYIKFMKPFYDKQVREYELEKKQIAEDSMPKAPTIINKYVFAEKEDKNVVEEREGSGSL
jgi:hypothetical protein